MNRHRIKSVARVIAYCTVKLYCPSVLWPSTETTFQETVYFPAPSGVVSGTIACVLSLAASANAPVLTTFLSGPLSMTLLKLGSIPSLNPKESSVGEALRVVSAAGVSVFKCAWARACCDISPATRTAEVAKIRQREEDFCDTIFP